MAANFIPSLDDHDLLNVTLPLPPGMFDRERDDEEAPVTIVAVVPTEVERRPVDKGKGPLFDADKILGSDSDTEEEEDYLYSSPPRIVTSTEHNVPIEYVLGTSVPTISSSSSTSTTASTVMNTLRQDPEWVEMKQREIEAITYNPNEVVIPSPQTLNAECLTENLAESSSRG